MPFIYTIFFITAISLVPMMLYVFYVAHSRNIDKKEKKIVLSFTIFSIFYFILNTEAYLTQECLLFGTVPIVLAISRRRYFESFIMLILLIIHYIVVGEVSISLLWIIAVFIVAIVDIYILSVSDDILKYHESYRELLEENMIKASLFKIAHEVKNPLAVALGYLEMIDVNDTKQCKKYIPIIKESIDHSLVILQDFSDLGKIKIEKELMDINMLIEDTVSILKLLLKERNINLNLNLIDDDIYIEADYNRLTQVIINLVKNSMEAIKENGTISISTFIENDKIYILISDDGEGIKEEILSRISEPFFTTKCNGTGLGVFLSQEIIKKHNGEIIYSSVINDGTEVKLILPIKNQVN